MIKILVTIAFVLNTFVVFSQEKLINVNGKNFNVYVKGFESRKKGAPAIIFENGLGMGLGNWNTVIDEIAKFAPVFAYDRAGVEKSDSIHRMPTVKIVAENLKSILTTMKIAPPYVVIGHSMGGLYARGFAGFYPNDIAGLVFIDPADFTESKEEWNSIFRTMGIPEKKIDDMLYNRLYRETKIDSSRFGISSEAAVLGELRRTDFAEVNALPVPSVPIYFFMGGKFEVPPERRSKDFNQEEFFHVRTDINIKRWRKFIYSSPKGGSLIYLSNCGHFVHRDDPKAFITNIRFMVEGLKP